jgi:hypothetical protein
MAHFRLSGECQFNLDMHEDPGRLTSPTRSRTPDSCSRNKAARRLRFPRREGQARRPRRLRRSDDIHNACIASGIISAVVALGTVVATVVYLFRRRGQAPARWARRAHGASFSRNHSKTMSVAYLEKLATSRRTWLAGEDMRARDPTPRDRRSGLGKDEHARPPRL